MITKQFGARIRALRNAKGLSQEKFALSIDMDRTYYASVESGKRNISINNIAKIIIIILIKRINKSKILF